DAAVLLDVEDLAQRGAQRADEARREPDEDERTDAEEAGGLLEQAADVAADLGIELGTDGRQRLEQVAHERLLGADTVAALQDEAGHAEHREDERHDRDEHVERDRARHEEDLVLLGLLPDAAREVAGSVAPARQPRAWRGWRRRRAPAVARGGGGGSAGRRQSGHGGPAAALELGLADAARGLG